MNITYRNQVMLPRNPQNFPEIPSGMLAKIGKV